jgi:hypothetical protein
LSDRRQDAFGHVGHRHGDLDGWRPQKAACRLGLLEQRLDLAAKRFVAVAGVGHKRRAIGRSPFQRSMKDFLDPAPTIWVHRQSS